MVWESHDLICKLGIIITTSQYYHKGQWIIYIKHLVWSLVHNGGIGDIFTTTNRLLVIFLQLLIIVLLLKNLGK